MSGRIMVDHGALEQAASDLARGVAATVARLEQLEHELDPLRSEWYGQAQQAWQVAQSQWQAAETEMHRLLGELGRRVSAAQVAYRDADLAGARAFQ